jgi:hypothetical protein
MELNQPEYVQAIKRTLMELFDIEELEALAFDLGIDWDNLRGTNKELKVQTLINYHKGRGKLKSLIAEILEKRPNAKLPEVPTPLQQIEDADYSVYSPGNDLKIQMSIKSNVNDISGSYIFVKALARLIEQTDTGLWQKSIEEVQPHEFYAALLTAVAHHYSVNSVFDKQMRVYEWLDELTDNLRHDNYFQDVIGRPGDDNDEIL